MPPHLYVVVAGKTHRLAIDPVTGAMDPRPCRLSEAQVLAAVKAHGVLLEAPAGRAHRCVDG
jgi:hypothetical protein